VNRSRTLEQLEADPWPVPNGDESFLIQRCHALRRVPIDALSPEDLRILLSQNIGTVYLLPVGLEVLERNPLIECDHYPGDLLAAAMGVDPSIWPAHPDWLGRLRAIAVSARSQATGESVSPRHRQLLREIDAFLVDRAPR
jgi:hypothetical protein